MRITHNMMSYNYLNSLNSSLEKQSKIQEQLADGKCIHRPSDNPVKAVRSLKYATSIDKNEQFSQNLSDAQSWMNSTDKVMSDLSTVMIKTKQLVTSADSSKRPSDINTIGKQIDEMVNQIVSLANTQVGNRYIFGGQSESTKPFERKTIKDPNSDKTIDVVVYNGDTSKVSMPIQDGEVNPFQDSVNLTGTDVFGKVTNMYGQPTMSVLNHLLEIKNEMMKTSDVSQTNKQGGIGTVTGDYTGAGYKNYDIRVDSVNAAGEVTAASYSIDGGNEWYGVGTIAATSIAAGDPAVIQLPDGVNFNITASPRVSKSNASGGVGALSGTAVRKEGYTVRVDSVDGSGQVQTASYSTDNGTTWTKFSSVDTSAPATSQVTLPNGQQLDIATNASNTINDTYTVGGNLQSDVYSFRVPQTAYSVKQSNDEVAANNSYVTGTYTGTGDTSYVVEVGSVDSSGRVTAARYSTDKGATWANVPKITTGNPSVIELTNGVKLNINADAKSKEKDTYTFALPQGTGPDVTWLSNVGLKYMLDDHNAQLKVHTQLGVRMSMYEMADNMMDDQHTIIETDQAANDGLDMAQAITDYNITQNVYRASLAVGGKIMQTSLVDFLK